MEHVWEIKPYNSDWNCDWMGYDRKSRPAPPRSIYVNKKKKNARKAQRKARKRNR